MAQGQASREQSRCAVCHFGRSERGFSGWLRSADPSGTKSLALVCGGLSMQTKQECGPPHEDVLSFRTLEVAMLLSLRSQTLLENVQ
jgi:hypothetical protein